MTLYNEMNLQQIPSYTNLIRNAFIADEGRLLASIDFSSQELRILTEISNDRVMFDIFTNDGDAHSTTAVTIWDNKYPDRQTDIDVFQRLRKVSDAFRDKDGELVKDKFKDEEHLKELLEEGIILTKNSEILLKEAELGLEYEHMRKKAKSVNFSIVYGTTSMGLSDNLEISEEEAMMYINSYMQTYPGVARWMNETKKTVREKMYVETLLGRKRRLYPEVMSGKQWLLESAYRVGMNCVDEKTEILTKGGWRKYYEVEKGDIVLTKNKDSGVLEWKPLKDKRVYRKSYGDLYSFESRTFSALSTENHRWLVYDKASKKNVFKASGELSLHGDHRIHRTGEYISKEKYDDDYVRLVGWLVTDGHIRTITEGKTYAVCISQSYRGNPKYCKEIEELLENNGWLWRVYSGSKDCTNKYWLAKDIVSRLVNQFPDKNLTPEFMRNLSNRQAQLLIDTMIKGDGTTEKGKRKRLCCPTKHQADMFQMLCVLGGYASTVQYRDMSKYKPKSKYLNNIPKMTGIYIISVLKRDKAQVTSSQVKVLKDDGRLVWCPQVENETWVARRDGKVYITGNSPIQGSAADMTKKATIDLQSTLKKYGCHVVLFIHDELLIDVPEDIGMEPLQEFADIMCNAIPLKCGMKSDIEISRRWGQKMSKDELKELWGDD